MWDYCVIDASMGVRGGFCFCPVELDAEGQITSVITGANFVGAPPRGSKVVAVVHDGGQDAVEAFWAENEPEIEALFAAQAMEARSGETRSGSTEGDSAVAKPCAQDPAGSNRHG